MAGQSGLFDATKDFALEIGGTFDGEIESLNDDDTPVDLTGFTLLWQVRKNATDVDLVLNIGMYCTIPTPANGIIVYSVPPSVTSLLSPLRGVHDLLLRQGDYGRFQFRGEFHIVPTVSREVAP